MNRRQEERVADLGRAFQSALEEIIDMGEGETRNYREEYEQPISIEEEYEYEQPTAMPIDMNDRLAQWDVNIKHVHNGFIVSVGCQTFVFETFDKMAKYMTMYYEDPRGTFEKHHNGELLKQYL
jgi:hypothetical protein